MKAVLDSARTLELVLRGLGHGLAPLGQRLARVEREIADAHALAAFLAAARLARPAPRRLTLVPRAEPAYPTPRRAR